MRIRIGMWSLTRMIDVSAFLFLSFPFVHLFSLVPKGDTKYYKSPFLRDFWHLNVAMMTSNNALIPDPDKEDILASKPFDWPLLHLGLRMCGWGDQQLKYYLIGTPIIWWGGTISLGVGLLVFVVYMLRWQRKYQDMDIREWEHFMYVGKVAFFGWAFHFGESFYFISFFADDNGVCSAIFDHGSCHLYPSLCTSLLSSTLAP